MRRQLLRAPFLGLFALEVALLSVGLLVALAILAPYKLLRLLVQLAVDKPRDAGETRQLRYSGGPTAASSSGTGGRPMDSAEPEDVDFTSPAHIFHMALIVLRLAQDPSWIRRRTDRFSMADQWTFQQEIKLELVVRDLSKLIGEPVRLKRIPVPLTLHAKRFLTDFRITDEDGKELSMLSIAEDRPIVTRMLEAGATVLLGTAPSGETSGLLLEITGPIKDAVRAWERLSKTHEGSQLVADRTFKALIDDLVGQFFIMALLEYKIGAAHILRLRFDDSVTPRITRHHWWSFPEAITVPLPAGQAASYHAEFIAPPDLRFVDEGSSVEWVGFAAPTATKTDERHEEIFIAYASGGEPSARGTMKAAMRNRRGGAPLMAQALTVGTAIIFAAGLLGRVLASLRPSGDAAAAASVLVVIPGIYALFVLQPGGHPVTGQFSRGPRVAVVCAGVLALSGSAALATKFPSPPDWLGSAGAGWRFGVWLILTVLLAILAGFTIVLKARRW
jgi:hypothetical protein